MFDNPCKISACWSMNPCVDPPPVGEAQPHPHPMGGSDFSERNLCEAKNDACGDDNGSGQSPCLLYPPDTRLLPPSVFYPHTYVRSRTLISIISKTNINAPRHSGYHISIAVARALRSLSPRSLHSTTWRPRLRSTGYACSRSTCSSAPLCGRSGRRESCLRNNSVR